MAKRRVWLIHWNEQEAAPRLDKLRKLGCDAGWHEDIRKLGEWAAELVVIDLSRLPSHGRQVADYVWSAKSRRAMPIVFVGGEPAKVEVARKQFPGAHFCEWDQIGPVIERAFASPPREAGVTPGPMASYAPKPLAGKLGIKPNSVVSLVEPPTDFLRLLEGLPGNVGFVLDYEPAADIILFFLRSTMDLRDVIARLRRLERPTAWLVYPKKSASADTALTQSLVRESGMAAGWVDFKVCAVDATWTALAFRKRRGPLSS